MITRCTRAIWVTVCLLTFAGCTQVRLGDAATVNPLATQAAINTLHRGGNAIDAAVSAALTLNVVDANNSGIGGGCFILIHTADGKTIAIDGRETAPAAAGRDLYIHHGQADTTESKLGARAIGVPGALAAYAYAQQHYGKLKLADVIRPAADLAERGTPVSAVTAARLQSVVDEIRQYPATAAIFLDNHGQPLHAGDTLVQRDLANTFRHIADDGPAWFYRGTFAQRCAAWMKQHGGIMTAGDLASYHCIVRQPIVSTYRGYTIYGFGPPSSGGVHVAQILKMLERFDLKSMSAADRAHLLVEAMKRAFADRAQWLGDPAFADVPRGLLDDDYLQRRGAGMTPNGRAASNVQAGQPPRAGIDIFEGRHTTHFCTADDEGNWVSITATINTSFGSKVVIGGTGVVMNNEMDDFSVQPGVPNAFGLVGAEANSVAAGKRPLSSMSPTIVVGPDGRVAFECGAAGGPTIITQVVQIIVNRIDLGMSLHDAVGAPRLHHQWKPDVVYVEKSTGPAVIESLQQRGYKIEMRDRIGFAQALGERNGHFVAVHDPRLE